jgi:ferritin
MVRQYEPGDLVTSTLIVSPDFVGVVRSVDPKINKVMVAWGGGSLSQHDPDELQFKSHQSEVVKDRMASRRTGKQASTEFMESLGVAPSNPVDSSVQTDFLSPKMEELLNAQVGYEFYSAYLYFLAAGWFQSKGLVGFQCWMEKQGKGEIDHGMKIYKYLVDTGSELELPSIPAPVAGWNEVAEVTRAVLDHEMSVTKRWKNIGELAKSEPNLATQELAQWFATEQVEEEDAAVTLHQKVQMAEGGTGILIIDTDLKDRAPNVASSKVASAKTAGEKAMVAIAEAYRRLTDEIPDVKRDDKFMATWDKLIDWAKKFDSKTASYDSMTTDGPPYIAEEKVANLKSRRAMYWCSPQRTYRLTKREIADDTTVCPKCLEKMELEPYTKCDRMYRCPTCSFKVPKSNVVVTTVASELKSRRGARN